MARSSLKILFFLISLTIAACFNVSWLARRRRCVVCCGMLEGTIDSPDRPTYIGLQHAGVIVSDTNKSLKFYTEVLGFIDETHLRPNLPFKGAFVRAGEQQLHLMELDNPDPVEGRPEHGGRDRHLAFSVESIAPIAAVLKKHNRPYTMSRSGRAALFTRDLDGNAFEFLEL